MSGTRFSLLLATTAIVMVLASPSHKAFAGPTTDADISAAVPMPESANLAPPTVDDLATVTEQPTGASSPMPSLPADRVAPAAAAPEIAAPAVVAPSKPTATLSPPAPVQVMPVDAAPAPAAAPVVPAAAPAPAATPAPAAETPAAEAPPAAPLTLDQRIAQKVQELIGTKGDRILGSKYKAA